MTQILGILNVTPDSFSDGGRYADAGAAIAHARRLRVQGADIIDIGGESTRPGASPITIEAEQQRILPVVRELAREGFTLSIDTMHAGTAAKAVEAGAQIVNDVSGGLFDATMAATVADSGAMLVVMHWRGLDVTRGIHYDDVVADVRAELEARVEAVTAAGVRTDRIVLDPGFGFSKDDDANWRLLAGLPEIVSLGFPVLVGASRKRFLGSMLPDGSPMEARDAGSAAVSMLAMQAGAWGVRVHDVAASRRSLDVLERAQGAGREPAPVAAPSEAPAVLGRDRIELTGLRAFAHHGVLDHERVDGQEFVVDVTVELDVRSAAEADALAQTVDYGELAAEVVAAVERDPADLIETVAERVARVALTRPRAERVRVTVHKPSAPIEVPFDDVAVTIERARA